MKKVLLLMSLFICANHHVNAMGRRVLAMLTAAAVATVGCNTSQPDTITSLVDEQAARYSAMLTELGNQPLEEYPKGVCCRYGRTLYPVPDDLATMRFAATGYIDLSDATVPEQIHGFQRLEDSDLYPEWKAGIFLCCKDKTCDITATKEQHLKNIKHLQHGWKMVHGGTLQKQIPYDSTQEKRLLLYFLNQSKLSSTVRTVIWHSDDRKHSYLTIEGTIENIRLVKETIGLILD